MGTDSRRILIATVASILILLGWEFLFPKPKPAPPPPQVAAAPAGAAGQAPAPVPAAPPVRAPEPTTPEERVTLQGGDFQVELSTWGGSIAHVRLSGDKFRREAGGETVAIDLVHVEPGQALPLSLGVSPELGGWSTPALDPAIRAPMRIARRDESGVTFEGRVGAAEVVKTYRLTGKPYELALTVAVTGTPVAGSVALVYPGVMPPETSKGGLFSGPPLDFVRPACRAGDKTQRFDVNGDASRLDGAGSVAWVGIDQHYFISAMLPSVDDATCALVKGADKGAGAALLQVPVPAGGRTFELTLFAGPKQLDLLQGYGRGFDTAIDYGPVTNFFSFFAQILLRVMRWFEHLAHNWGVAIILLTLAVKLILYPLTHKSMQSMAAMRKLQPEMEKLKAQHGGDKEKLNLAMMQLYQKHKVNPLGGCLPMLLQMPVWFALYAALQTSVELYRAHFLWISDLSVRDPYFILPVAMGLTSFAMQKLSPQPADSSQAKMMLYFFPIFFTVMMLFVPAGLTLYIFVNNILSIVQQQMVNRTYGVGVPAKA